MMNKAHQLIGYKDGERTRLCRIEARHVSEIETPSMILPSTASVQVIRVPQLAA